MQTEPEVLTEHTELICSTNIERIVTGRDAALQQIEQLLNQLQSISMLTATIGGGTAEDWALKQGHRYDCWLTETPAKAMPAITRTLDRNIWRDLMLKSGMLSLMDAEARTQWHKNLDEGDLPVISEANIFSTFEQLHQSKQEVFERGVVNVFKGLSWDYKTNHPCYFGKKIIISNLVTYNRWGFGLNWGWPRDQLADLERMLYLLDGKPIPDNRGDLTIRLMDHIRDNPHQQGPLLSERHRAPHL
ncbi:restriction methylase [Pectobacterium carotovorum subsp. carotovorum]|nr:restriction methylase [Pectobacterium carotovorum subsp. carotovorum]